MATSEPPPLPEAGPHDAGGLPASAQARLLRAVESSLDGFWEYELDTDHAWYSDSLRRMLGHDATTLPDGHGRLSQAMHLDDLATFEAALAAAAGAPFEHEIRLRDANGCWRWLRVRVRTWPGPDGAPIRLTGTLTDVHEAHEARLALARMSERYERAVLATQQGLFERMLDEDRMFISDRVWHALGYEPGELPPARSTFIGLMHPDDLPDYQRIAAQATQELSQLDAHTRFRCKSGEYRWFHQIATPHRRPDGRVRITGVLIDVDEPMRARLTLERDRAALEHTVAERTARLEAALAQAEEARAEAERADAAKSLFVAHMSHEIRTPLNGVLGLTELALQMASSPTQRRHLEVALQSGQALLQVVDEVLAFSRSRSEIGPLADEPFDLFELLAVTMRSVMPLAHGHEVAVRFDCIGERSRVRGDAARLRQIVINLLGNAMKFTERGHVGLIVEVADTADGCLATMRFEDTGPGIPPEQQARVFDAFVQGDASLSRRYGGTGLGLATADAVARAMGGTIALQSRVGEGSVFTLTLPLATEGPPDPPPALPDGAVWLIATQQQRAVSMQERLRRIGGSTRTFDGIGDAVAAARGLAMAEQPTAVLLSQWALTDAATLHALRAALPRAAVSLLLRPDWHEPALERTAEMLGMACALLPLTPRALQALITRPAAPAAPARLPQASVPAPCAAQPLPLHVLLVEDNPVNRMIGEGFLRALGLPTQTADDGAQALAACARETPALVLMDLQMPVMDGLEATRRLRALQQAGQLQRFPIVALTAHALQSDRDEAEAAGMDGYLTKPLLLEALRHELQRWLPTLGA